MAKSQSPTLVVVVVVVVVMGRMLLTNLQTFVHEFKNDEIPKSHIFGRGGWTIYGPLT